MYYSNAKSIYHDFIAYLENHPIANSDMGNRYSSSKRSSSSGASKTSKTRVSDGTYSASSTKHPKTTEKDSADGDHNRSRKRTSSAMEETYSQLSLDVLLNLLNKCHQKLVFLRFCLLHYLKIVLKKNNDYPCHYSQSDDSRDKL
jgi:hypothetical protein